MRYIASIMRQPIDLTGMIYGRWTVLERNDTKKYGGSTWVCKCTCGTIKIVPSKILRNGHSKSCGCLNDECKRNRKPTLTHGMTNTRLHRIWSNMKGRCNNLNSDKYEDYGGRGISVCEEWGDFQTFYDWAMSHGYDDDLSLDRIDNDGNYCPENCRWVTPTIQQNNTRKTIHVTIKNETHTLSEWSEITGLSKMTIRNRHHKGKRGYDLIKPKQRGR